MGLFDRLFFDLDGDGKTDDLEFITAMNFFEAAKKEQHKQEEKQFADDGEDDSRFDDDSEGWL